MDPPRFRVREAVLLGALMIALVPLCAYWWVRPPRGGPFSDR